MKDKKIANLITLIQLLGTFFTAFVAAFWLMAEQDLAAIMVFTPLLGLLFLIPSAIFWRVVMGRGLAWAAGGWLQAGRLGKLVLLLAVLILVVRVGHFCGLFFIIAAMGWLYSVGQSGIKPGR